MAPGVPSLPLSLPLSFAHFGYGHAPGSESRSIHPCIRGPLFERPAPHALHRQISVPGKTLPELWMR